MFFNLDLSGKGIKLMDGIDIAGLVMSVSFQNGKWVPNVRMKLSLNADAQAQMNAKDSTFRNGVFVKAFEALNGFKGSVPTELLSDGAEVSVAFESVNVSLRNVPGAGGPDKPVELFTSAVELKMIYRASDQKWIPASEVHINAATIDQKGLLQAAQLAVGFRDEKIGRAHV